VTIKGSSSIHYTGSDMLKKFTPKSKRMKYKLHCTEICHLALDCAKKLEAVQTKGKKQELEAWSGSTVSHIITIIFL
jgi:hypothetical protein